MQNDKLSKLIKRIKRRNLTINLLLYPVLLLSIISITIYAIDETYMSDIGEPILLILGLLFAFIVLILMIPECIDYFRDGLIDSVKNKLNEEELRYVEEATKPHKWEVEYWRQKICSILFKNKKDNKSTSILSKRTERKQLSILAFIISITICEWMPEYFDITHEIAYNLLMLIASASLVTIIVFWIKGIQDLIKNGSTKALKKNLNNEEKQLLKEIMIKRQWIKYSWIILLIVFLIKSFNNPDINNTSVEQTSQTKTVETPKSAPSKPKKEEVKQSQPKEDYTWFAEYACQQEIKARAIYPPSVKVHFRRDNYIKGNSYTVYGTVDSQNVFGAMERHNFACEAIIDKENDKYWVNDLNIE